MPEYKIVDFDAQEIMEIVDLANERQTNKENHNVAEQAFKPDQQKGFRLHMLGLMGEAAVAKYLDTDIETAIFRGGDYGYDLEIHNTRISVKSTTFFNENRMNLIVKTDEHEAHDCDLYVLCSIHDPCRAYIRGCISWKKFDQIKDVRNFGAGDRYFVDLNDLSNMEVFHQHIFGF